MIKTILHSLVEHGFLNTCWIIQRRVRGSPADCWQHIAKLCQGSKAFEIGGPSDLFRPGGLLPVYPLLARLDNANYAPSTTWESSLEDGGSFHYHEDRPGTQYIREATDLHGIADESYDLVLSSHMLEHTANPLKVMQEKRRLLKPGGHLLIIVPHKDGTSGDRPREVTTLEHLKEDFLNGTTELQMGEENYQHRMRHVHVFDCRLLTQVLQESGFELLQIQAVLPFNIIAFARKTQAADNQSWLDAAAPHLRHSPFSTDRKPH